jgi:hypothetical protein
MILGHPNNQIKNSMPYLSQNLKIMRNSEAQYQKMETFNKYYKYINKSKISTNQRFSDRVDNKSTMIFHQF